MEILQKLRTKLFFYKQRFASHKTLIISSLVGVLVMLVSAILFVLFREGASQPQALIGYAGCSITIQTVEGYKELGGQGMWPPEQGFDDGSVFNWNNPQGHWRAAFNKNVAMYPETKIIWWQLCVPVHEAEHLTYAHVENTVDFFKTRLPEATIYVSSLAPYQHLCEGSGAAGVPTGQRLAEELVSKRADVKLGPIFSTLTTKETENDQCHLNDAGKQKMGLELREFFDNLQIDPAL